MASNPAIEEITKSVFDLYRNHGSDDYIGENVTQIEHATQCAMLAEKEGFDEQVILGAFLHDIGHLLSGQTEDHMFTDGLKLGVKQHEKVGEEFLQNLNVPEKVSAIVKGHVDAKRYLCYRYPKYMDSLSQASTLTLTHQGGPMTESEAITFETSPYFEIMLKARKWDEVAKVEGMALEPLEKYEDMFRRVLLNMFFFKDKTN